MTDKERWLHVIDGGTADRLLFWPKILGKSYLAGQQPPYCNMSLREIYDAAGCDMQIYLTPCCRLVYGDCSYEERVEEGVMYREFVTPSGVLKGTLLYDPVSDSYSPQEQIVTSKRDIEILTYFFRQTHAEWDVYTCEENRKEYEELGDRGLCVSHVCESPLMDFLEWYAGIAEGQYMYFDYPEELDALFAEMQRVNCECMEIMCRYSPADVLYITENTSTTVISPGQFDEYCRGHLREYAQIAEKHGRRLIFHMCGQLGKILPMLTDIPNTGIEALSTPPLGNTTFAKARGYLPDKALIGGTCALTWLRDTESIIREIDGYLGELDDYRGIVVGTGGMIPPACTPDTLKRVREYIFSLPVKERREG